jgi:cell division septal protein FtsQ
MKMLAICTAILLVSSIAYIIVSFLFSLQTIEVVGTNVQVIIDEKKMSKNLFFFPSDRVRKEILTNNTLLSDVQFQKKYPHTLVIVPAAASICPASIR